jgi:hypothetical protein
MLADGYDDLAAAIDENGGAGPLEPWTQGDLDNRDGQQRNEEENQRSHVIPRQADVPAEVTINKEGKTRIQRTLQKCILPEDRL